MSYAKRVCPVDQPADRCSMSFSQTTVCATREWSFLTDSGRSPAQTELAVSTPSSHRSRKFGAGKPPLPAFEMRFLEPKLHAPASTNRCSKRLEAIAECFGVLVLGRHTALGDAMVTAEEFLKLIPLIVAERGIHTLGQARRGAADLLRAGQLLSRPRQWRASESMTRNHSGGRTASRAMPGRPVGNVGV